MTRVRIPRSDWSKHRAVVYVLCPGSCQQRYRLDHAVDARGHVDPSLDCPTCELHDYVLLEGWTG